MKIQKIYFPVLIFSIISKIYVFAQAPFSIENTKYAGMGDAVIAVAKDDAVLTNNVAGLALIENQIISSEFTIQDYTVRTFDQSWYFTRSAIQANYVRNNFGIAAGAVRKGNQNIRVLGILSAFYDSIFYERFIQLSYARGILSHLNVGVTAKYNYSSASKFMEFDDKHALSFDVGMLYKRNKFSAGMTVKNLAATDLNYAILSDIGTPVIVEKLGRNFNIGASYFPMRRLRLIFDIKNLFEEKIPSSGTAKDLDTFRSYHFGVEFKALETLFLRAGLISNKALRSSMSSVYRNRNTLTSGIGLKLNSFLVNVAVIFDNRKKDIESTKQPVGPTVVDGYTFRYLMSLNWEL